VITFKATFHSRIGGKIRGVKAAAATSAWMAAHAVLAEAQRRVRRGKTGETLASLEVVGQEGDATLKIGSSGSHGGRPIPRFLETGTAHNHAFPFLRPAAALGRKALKQETEARIRAEAAKTGSGDDA
jgi:hypothetical protein